MIPQAFAAPDDWTTRGSATAVSDYVARGLSLSWGQPALQAEWEAEHASGLYAGLWGSSVSPRLFPGGRAETSAWIGFAKEWREDTSLGIEALYTAYPGANLGKAHCSPGPCASQTLNTLQARLLGSWKWVTLRHSVSLTDYYGAARSTGFAASTRGTTYTELTAEPDLPGDGNWRLIMHLGATRYAAPYAPTGAVSADPSYRDMKLGFSKTWAGKGAGWRLSLVWSRATNTGYYGNTPSLIDDRTLSLGKPRIVLGLSREVE